MPAHLSKPIFRMSSIDMVLWPSYMYPDGPRPPPSPYMKSATQVQLKAMMHGETGKLLELKEELEKEMKLISEEFISNKVSEVEHYRIESKSGGITTKIRLRTL